MTLTKPMIAISLQCTIGEPATDAILSPPRKRNFACGSSIFNRCIKRLPCKSPDASPAMMKYFMVDN